MLRKKRALWVAIIVLILAAGGAYYYYDTVRLSAQVREEAPVQTTTVRRGDIVVSASGTGRVIPAAEMDVAFSSEGVLTEVLVQVGDQVHTGDELARIDDLDARQAVANAEAQVAKAQSDLATGQNQLDDLLAGNSEADVLEAQAAVKTAEENLAKVRAGPTEAETASAEAALATAQENYQRLQDGPDAGEIERAELALSRAKNSLWSTQSGRDATCGQSNESTQCKSAQASVLNGEISVRLAEMDLADLKAPATQAEIQDALAQLTQAKQQLEDLRGSPTPADLAEAEAQLAQAKANLDDLTASPSESDVSTAQEQVDQAQLNLDQAQLNLESAQKDLEGTTLVAPTDGTVMTVAAAVGENAGTTSFVTLADLSHPYLEIFLDETDLDKIGVGYEVEVTLDALPDDVYTGHVIQVDPSLTSSGGVSTVRAVVKLDEASFSKPQGLPVGSNASVDVIGGRAQGAVLVPVEALRELEPGKYAVFVMENGEPKLRTVEVGLMDYSFAEIKSGLEPGDVVTTGIVETK